MADYARRGDQAQWMRNISEQARRLKTARPRRGGAPAPGWAWYGDVTLDTFFPPQLLTIDPVDEGEYPEYKRIVGFDGWLLTGSVEVAWYSEELGTPILSSHDIVAGGGIGNRVMLDEPYIIENGVRGGEMIQPYVLGITGTPRHLTCTFIVETVPV